MAVVKRVLAVLAVVVAVMAGLFFWYLRSLPTMPPQVVLAGDSSADTRVPFRCQPQPVHTVYRVAAQVESLAGDQILYTSELNFRLHLQQEQADRFRGLVSDVQIAEQQQPPQPMEDMAFLSRAVGDQALVFIAFNDLGLMKQHPLAMVGQVLKNISVGDSTQVYRYAYDALQRTYRYQHSGSLWQRFIPVVQTGYSSQRLQPLWQIRQDDQCLPQSLQAEEIQPLSIGSQDGLIRFRMQVQRADDPADLTGLDFSAMANRHLTWQAAQVSLASQVVADVRTDAEMWAVFQDFSASKDTARLMRAARYLLDSVSVYELARQLTDSGLPDSARRDLIFALGLVRDSAAEGYLLDLLQALPSGEQNAELQKVRIMVAVAGNGDVSDYAYRILETLARNPAESPNIRNNALINLGTVVQQRSQQGDTGNALRDELSADLLQRLHNGRGEDVSAAIFSAGNAGLLSPNSPLLSAVQQTLGSDHAKERYAAATVLSRSVTEYDALIRHLQQESSTLVNNAILYGLKPGLLSDAQKQSLQSLADNKPELQPLIAKLL